MTFIANQNDSALQLDDANFWEKALPKSQTRIGRIVTLFNSEESLKYLKGIGAEDSKSIKESKKARLDAWKR